MFTTKQTCNGVKPQITLTHRKYSSTTFDIDLHPLGRFVSTCSTIEYDMQVLSANTRN